MRPGHWAPRHRLEGSSGPPPKSPLSLRLTIHTRLTRSSEKYDRTCSLFDRVEGDELKQLEAATGRKVATQEHPGKIAFGRVRWGTSFAMMDIRRHEQACTPCSMQRAQRAAFSVQHAACSVHSVHSMQRAAGSGQRAASSKWQVASSEL